MSTHTSKIKILLIAITVAISISNTFAQLKPTQQNNTSVPVCEKLDVIDIYRRVMKKSIRDSCEEAKEKDEVHLAILPAFGYSLVTRLAGVVAGNIAFYTDDRSKAKISSINTSICYTQNNQIIFPVLSNIWTKENRFNWLGDWRYYRYPEYTYGLGGHTSLKKFDLINYSCIIVHEAVLKHVYNSSVYAGIAYNLNYHWNITESGNSDGTVTDFQKYSKTKKSISSGISLNLLYDDRKNSINPSQSFYSSLAYCPNFTFLGSDKNYNCLVTDVRKYFKPSSTSDNILAFWNYNWFTFNGNAPYLDLPSTGWDAYANMGRGYIQSRLRGKNLMYLEAEYRFGIMRNGLFGGVVFTNVQTVTDWPTNKFQVFYPAVGTGLRIKINKYSGTNLAIDYAIGINGSQGIFINLGEVF
ncbi:MAG TPA: BamA/TamA family outer membrane protein [Bacteroidia bacterium]|nr:BamA/TamA family outer membrane protein [Bacteroidia bacterium]